MLKVLALILLPVLAWGNDGEHATISLQRWSDKLVVTVQHDEGWHTYWKNPGDAGIASTFKFSRAGKQLELKAHEWPVPKRYLETGDILTIGYSGTQHFFFDDSAGEIEAHVGVLICKDICIPGEAKLKLESDRSFVSNRPSSHFSANELQKAFELLPGPAQLPQGFEYHLTRKKDQNLLTLHYSLKGVKDGKLPHELLFLTPFPRPPFGYKRETLYFKDGTLYGKTEIEWDGEYLDPPMSLPSNGAFSSPESLDFLLNAPGSDRVKKVTLKVKDFALATPSLDDFYKKLASPQVTQTTEGGLFKYLLLAFFGGLILNLMPCVLPVISLKLFGLIKHKEVTQKRLLAHNVSYTSGVLSTFMVLASVVSLIKATGEEIGWGFQLQSPIFILLMMVILFVLALNLFGLFEFTTPGGNKLGNVQTEEGLVGDFFSGVLTTILSTPCSAPFLGTALTFAFSANYFTIYLMFTFIGLGLAFPFLMTALFPHSLAFLPRPGLWMEKMKYFLGLTLIATVVWLQDVFTSLVDLGVMGWKLNLIFALIFFAFFFARKVSTGKAPRFVFFVLPLLLMANLVHNLTKPVKAATPWMAWSEEALTQEKGKMVFMDFTAEWCLTCKVNKKFVLDTDGFYDLQAKHQLVLMRADWTKRDDHITKFLKEHGAVGVPAYFIQKADGNIISLGETISLTKIEENI